MAVSMRRCGHLLLTCVAGGWALEAKHSSSQDSSISLEGGNAVVQNTLLTGESPDTLSPASLKSKGQNELTTEDGGSLRWHNLAADIVQVEGASPSGGSVGAAFAFPANDSFYGVWEYPWNGSLTNNGHSYGDVGIFGAQAGTSWANARAPFFFSRSGFGVYIDTTQYGTFDFSQPGQVRFTFNTTTLTYSVMYNANLTALLSQFAGFSNKIAMLPEAGYGPIFWSDDWEQDFHGNVTNAQDNIMDVVNHLASSKIRATGILADRPYGTGNGSFGNFDFDPKFFPRPAEDFIGNLTTAGFDFQLWVANRATPNTELYNVSSANGWLFAGMRPSEYLGPALNLSIPAAYNYLVQKLTGFARLGVKGFKIDRGEEHEMPDSEQNTQNVLLAEVCSKALASVWGEGKYYNFARSAFDRARSRLGVWNGDSQADFTGLEYSVASGIRAGLIGFSQWGSDTGGYLRRSGAPTEELWARWMHFSTFSPMYEVLIGMGHTPWYDYSPRLVEILRRTADLHTRLIPYIRSYTYQATQTGLPVMRALFLEYPSDDFIYEMADEYAFGKEFLVAPIVTEGGSRSVYFPLGGNRFLEYFNKTAIHKPGELFDISGLPLEYAPVYVREGAIIATGDVYRGNARAWDATWKPRLQIELFPSYNVTQSTFVYYRGSESTAGEGPATITMTTDRRNKSLFLEYGNLGAEGVLTIYHKTATTGATVAQNIPLANGGGGQNLRIDGLNSLFD